MVNENFANKIRKMMRDEEATGKYIETPEIEKKYAMKKFISKLNANLTPNEVANLWEEFKNSNEYRDAQREKEMTEYERNVYSHRD